MAANILISAAMGALMLAGYETVSIQSQQADQSGAVAVAAATQSGAAAGSGSGSLGRMASQTSNQNVLNPDLMGSAQSFLGTAAQ